MAQFRRPLRPGVMWAFAAFLFVVGMVIILTGTWTQHSRRLSGSGQPTRLRGDEAVLFGVSLFVMAAISVMAAAWPLDKRWPRWYSVTALSLAALFFVCQFGAYYLHRSRLDEERRRRHEAQLADPELQKAREYIERMRQEMERKKDK